ncbi:MAG: hypothetical protein ACLQDY_28185 [Streptosporangiaceae bacterium]
MNAATRYVVARTLENADAWPNSVLPRGDAAGAVAGLKTQPGRDLPVTAARRCCEACTPPP